MNIIYADNNATTRVAPEVVEAMMPFLTAEYFNPSSMYEAARPAAAAIKEARAEIARFFGLTDPNAILFTSCASESNNAAIFGAVKASPSRRHVITTAVEHPAVLGVCKELAAGRLRRDLSGRRSRRQPGPGRVHPRLAARHAAGHDHARQQRDRRDFPDRAALAADEGNRPRRFFSTPTRRNRSAKLPIDLRREFQHVDMLSFSGHKVHAPKGVGGLYIKRGARWRPYLIGGHQEEGRRAGHGKRALHRRAGQGAAVGRRRS